MKKALLFFIFVTTIRISGADFPVSSADGIDSVMKIAQPGDTITMKEGLWIDQVIEFECEGVENSPILLRAETPGRVVLTGKSRLRIGGKYLIIDGLRFVNGETTTSHVIEFRSPSSNKSHYCRLTNTSIEDYNPAYNQKDYKWVSLDGTHNEVDHCYFKGKTNKGALLVVWRQAGKADYHRIHHNYFYDRPEVEPGGNGYEAIRIGTSDYSMSSSYTVVEYNYFEKCDGEIEIISNKSCEDTLRYNTFIDCGGALTLRHGNGCVVEGNYFNGKNTANTGGLRIIGEDHLIFNNYFGNITGSGNRAAVSFENGVPDSPLNRYFQVRNTIFAFNTFVNNQNSISMGTGKSDERSLPPEDCVFANNIVQSETGPLISVSDEPENMLYEGNLFYGTELGMEQPEGISVADPLLVLSDDGIMRPGEGSPGINAAAGEYPAVTDDFDGQSRDDGMKDIGCDEFSSASVGRMPVTRDDVGPSWLKDNADLPLFLKVTSDGNGEGRVELDPPGGMYEKGQVVKLTAVPEEGSDFEGWEGDLAGNGNPDSIVMDTAKNVIAVFSRPPEYKLSIWKNGQGEVEMSPSGGEYLYGTVVTVTAKPDTDNGWVFSHWSGAIESSGNPDSLVIDGNKLITVHFVQTTGLEEKVNAEKRFLLCRNYPNPFSGQTKITFHLEKSGETRLSVYNLLGHEIVRPLNKICQSGKNEIVLDGSLFPAGTYIYELSSEGRTSKRTMTCVK